MGLRLRVAGARALRHLHVAQVASRTNAARDRVSPVVFDEHDPELDAWNAYLASVHQNDQSATPDKRDD